MTHLTHELFSPSWSDSVSDASCPPQWSTSFVPSVTDSGSSRSGRGTTQHSCSTIIIVYTLVISIVYNLNSLFHWRHYNPQLSLGLSFRADFLLQTPLPNVLYGVVYIVVNFGMFGLTLITDVQQANVNATSTGTSTVTKTGFWYCLVFHSVTFLGSPFRFRICAAN